MDKDAYYFPHDYNARSDPKLVKLAMEGWEYVGLYWAIVEMLHEQGGWLDVECEPIAFALRAHKDLIAKLINYPGVFKFKGGKFTCQRVLDNLKKREEIRVKSRNSALKRWGNANALPPHMPTHCEGNAIKERKGKEIKGKEKKVNKKKDIAFILSPEKFPYFLRDDFKKLYQDFLDMREAKNKPATDKAQDLILTKLHKHDFDTAKGMLNQSIINSWTDVYEPKKENQNGSNKNHNRQGSEYAGIETEIKL